MFSAIQILTSLDGKSKRQKELVEKIIPENSKIFNDYYIVSSENKEIESLSSIYGFNFVIYSGWERDKSRKFREGFHSLVRNDNKEKWIAFLDDDVYPDSNWKNSMSDFLKDKEKGQYGFRLTDEDNSRHSLGEDWMQFYDRRRNLKHRPLKYNTDTGWIEESPSSYVANCVVSRDVVGYVEPFGIFGAAPDVMWSMAIRSSGFNIGFNPKARMYHVGDRKDHR